MRSLALALVLGASACGREKVTCSGDGCNCDLSECVCYAGKSCAWTDTEVTGCNADGSSRSLACNDDSTCAGICGDPCRDAECTLTYGESSDIESDNSVCNATYGNSSSMDCVNGSTCMISVEESGSAARADSSILGSNGATCQLWQYTHILSSLNRAA